MFAGSKGFILHIGFGVLLLALIVLYILIYLNSPPTAHQITTGLGELRNSVTPTIKLP